tara:strand:+ start:44595 stop:45470 length:876 start_codon:yes stop_codon:yes gene_type:complete
MSKAPKKAVLFYRTIVLSDVHLGAPDCQIDKVNHFLKRTHSEKLILNGDIIDSWSLGRSGGWTKKHTRFIQIVLKKLEKFNVEMIYLRGNHDDILDRYMPLDFGRFSIVDKHIHEGPKGRYLVAHGDVFDAVTKNTKIIAVIGDICYQGLLRINRFYDLYRSWRGKELFSLSKAIKAKTKKIVNVISRFEKNVESFTLKAGCTGFICGHIHTPDDKRIGCIHYLNSGDWVESNSALVEHLDGRWEVINYEDFLVEMARVEAHREAEAEHKRTPVEEETDEDDSPVTSLPVT